MPKSKKSAQSLQLQTNLKQALWDYAEDSIIIGKGVKSDVKKELQSDAVLDQVVTNLMKEPEMAKLCLKELQGQYSLTILEDMKNIRGAIGEYLYSHKRNKGKKFSINRVDYNSISQLFYNLTEGWQVIIHELFHNVGKSKASDPVVQEVTKENSELAKRLKNAYTQLHHAEEILTCYVELLVAGKKPTKKDLGSKIIADIQKDVPEYDSLFKRNEKDREELKKLLEAIAHDKELKFDDIKNLNSNILNIALYYAAGAKKIGALQMILSHPSINPNLTRDDGATALYIAAAENGNLRVVRELLTHPKINPNLTRDDGATALDIVTYQYISEKSRKKDYMKIFKQIIHHERLDEKAIKSLPDDVKRFGIEIDDKIFAIIKNAPKKREAAKQKKLLEQKRLLEQESQRCSNKYPHKEYLQSEWKRKNECSLLDKPIDLSKLRTNSAPVGSNYIGDAVRSGINGIAALTRKVNEYKEFTRKQASILSSYISEKMPERNNSISDGSFISSKDQSSNSNSNTHSKSDTSNTNLRAHESSMLNGLALGSIKELCNKFCKESLSLNDERSELISTAASNLIVMMAVSNPQTALFTSAAATIVECVKNNTDNEVVKTIASVLPMAYSLYVFTPSKENINLIGKIVEFSKNVSYSAIGYEVGTELVNQLYQLGEKIKSHQKEGLEEISETITSDEFKKMSFCDRMGVVMGEIVENRMML